MKLLLSSRKWKNALLIQLLTVNSYYSCFLEAGQELG
jgi:hypothetical protein